MEEQAAQIGGGRELTDVFNVALPARQRRRAESAVFGAVIDAFDPDLEPVVQLIERERAFGIQIGDELLPDGAEAAFNLATALGLIRTRMNNEDAERGRDARQLR
jgi:hypothetical protein